MSFVHLHTHSHYSLLDGLPKIPDLVAKAKEYGCPALALTDHGVMYGVLEFYQECKKQGIKPIIGMEAYMALEGHEDKRAHIDTDYHHLTLLAKNEQGYRNLMQLSTLGHLQGFYYKPRIDKELLKAHSQGLIALSGCIRGEIPRLIIAGKYEQAKNLAQEFQDIFGKENFFGEVQKHPEIPEQEIANRGILRLCEELGMLAVASCDSHYLRQDDAEAQDVLICVQIGKFVTDKNRLDMRGVDHSFKTPDEIKEQWKDFPEVVSNTLKVADLCNLDLPLYKWAFPDFPAPEGKTADEYLRELVLKGAEIKFGSSLDETIKKRIEYELDVIKKTGFATYFLIVSDYVKWARSRGIAATTRGSAAGSIVSYLIDITTVNPLFFQLPFERFLTAARPSPPDIDVDFADNRRDEVIEYVKEKYGRDKVAQICTFGTMLARAAVRDVTRVLGLPYSFGDKLAKMVPIGSQGFHITIDRALEENHELGKLYDENNDVKRTLDLVRKVEGCARHASVHAAGMVIAPTNLTDFTPLQREPKGEKIITQYDMHAVEAAGLVKMDMLGIRNLSILGEAVRIVKKTKGAEIDLQKIPLDDKKTFELLSRGNTMGVFQLSGSGMTRYLKELKPSNVDDIMAMVALFRPGPIDSIPEYIKRKHNPRFISYLDPRLKAILERTHGILVYQDDVLLIAIELAGYTWEEADKLRKAMGKKIPREMIAQREKFLLGCVKGDMERKRAEELWALIEPFAAYGFNKAHAASYAMVAYQTAYMKAHYPAEYITAILTAESGNLDKIAEVIAGAREDGIIVLPPDVKESGTAFTYIDDTHIRFGLLAIKNLGTDVVEAIIRERDKSLALSNATKLSFVPYRDLEDFLKRVKHKNLNKKSLESLVKSGAMDCLGDRAQMLANMEEMLAFHRGASEAPTKQESLFINLPQAERKLNLKQTTPVEKNEKMQWEKELLGLYVSSHPLHEYEQALKDKVVSTGALVEMAEHSQVCLAGVLTESKKRRTKNGEDMLTGRLQDLSGSCELVVFPKAYKTSGAVLENGALLCVWGKGGGEEKRVVCDRAVVLTRETVNALNEQKTEDRIQKTDFSPPSSVFRPPPNRRVVICLTNPTKDILETLRAFLSSTRGNLPVYVEIEEQGKKRLIQTNFHLDPGEDIFRTLESIAGKGAVKISGLDKP